MHRPLPGGLLAVVAGGVVSLIAGVALFTRTGLAPDSFGWFAYAPLADTLYLGASPGQLAMMQPGSWWGLALAAIGALAVSGALGYALGSRHRRSPGSD